MQELCFQLEVALLWWDIHSAGGFCFCSSHIDFVCGILIQEPFGVSRGYIDLGAVLAKQELDCAGVVLSVGGGAYFGGTLIRQVASVFAVRILTL